MKFLRARGLSQEVFTTIEVNSAASNRRVVTEIGSDERTVAFKLSIDSPLPVREWSLSFGDAIHNYRAALDSLAWELAHWDGAEPAEEVKRKIYFPLCSTQQSWEQQLSGPLATVPEHLAARLYGVQPLHLASPRDAVGLALHELDIRDKHKACVEASTHTHSAGRMIMELTDANGKKVGFHPRSLRIHREQPFIDGQTLFSVVADSPVAKAESAMNVPVQFVIHLQDGRTVELFNFLHAVDAYLVKVFDLVYRGEDWVTPPFAV